MSRSAFSIRVSGGEDRDRVLSVHRNAFGGEDGEVIAKLVEELLDDPSAAPVCSFLAEQSDRIIGHVLFTAVRIETDPKANAQILAPVAVARDHQSRGIGTELINTAFDQLQADGVELVFVLGYPSYYSRFGFAAAGVLGLQAPYPILAKNADAWMVKELAPGAIDRYEGIVRSCQSLDRPQYWQE